VVEFSFLSLLAVYHASLRSCHFWCSMLMVWTAWVLFAATAWPQGVERADAPAPAQRYMDPSLPAGWVPEGRAPAPTPSAQVRYRPDGEVEVRIDGLRMEARATVDTQGHLLISCATPGHPAEPHVHLGEAADTVEAPR
jgi:hypothetical protein